MTLPHKTSASEGRFATSILRLAEICKIIGGIGIACYSALFLKLICINPVYILEQERKALASIKADFLNGTTLSATVPTASTAFALDLPPIAWIGICIIACIFFYFLVVQMWQMVVNTWQRVQKCNISNGFWSFLDCILSWIWAFVQTLVAIAVTVLLLVVVVINIVTIIEAF